MGSTHRVRPRGLPKGSAHGVCPGGPPMGSTHGVRPQGLPTGSVHGVCPWGPPTGSATMSAYGVCPRDLPTSFAHRVRPRGSTTGSTHLVKFEGFELNIQLSVMKTAPLLDKYTGGQVIPYRQFFAKNFWLLLWYHKRF